MRALNYFSSCAIPIVSKIEGLEIYCSSLFPEINNFDRGTHSDVDKATSNSMKYGTPHPKLFSSYHQIGHPSNGNFGFKKGTELFAESPSCQIVSSDPDSDLRKIKDKILINSKRFSNSIKREVGKNNNGNIVRMQE